MAEAAQASAPAPAPADAPAPAPAADYEGTAVGGGAMLMDMPFLNDPAGDQLDPMCRCPTNDSYNCCGLN